ncbi:hypothetical protein [Desulfobacter sp.]
MAVLSECAGYFIPGMAVKTVLVHGASNETAAYIFILLSKLTVIDLTLPSPVSIVSGAGTGLCVIMLKKFAMGPLESAMRYFPFVKAPRIMKKHPGTSTG